VSPKKRKAQQATKHGLKDVVLRELEIELDKEQQRTDWAAKLTPAMRDYAAEDSRVLLPLLEVLERRVQDADLGRVMEIEHRVLPAMAWMSSAGVPFDARGWGEHLEVVKERQERLKEELDDLAPAPPEGGTRNWNSWQQVIAAFGEVGVELADTREETLSRCTHPLAKTLLAYRRASKVSGTYGPALLERVEDGRIYPSWHQIGAGTGRMSCSKPNLQNLPPEARGFVCAPGGRMLVKADYSQIELRIAAKISEDERMLQAYENGEDLHAITAMSLTGREKVSQGERKLAKAVNFGLLYGQGAGGLRSYARSSYGVELSFGEARTYRERFFETYPGIRAWHEREWQEWHRGNTETRTLAGRRRANIGSFNERVNTPVQGTGADGLKLALALLWERRDECPDATPILAVHDEIVVECGADRVKKVEAWLEGAMIDGMDRVLNGSEVSGPRVSVEVEVESATSWSG
jgi:DNA polymerase-1